MYPEQNPATSDAREPMAKQSSSKFETTAFYVFLTTLTLTPLAFIPTPYIALDFIKAILIALGAIVPAILYGIVAMKEKKLVLPPKALFWTGLLISASLVISSLTTDLHAGKSFFGQGFELGAASFLLVLLMSSLVAFKVVERRPDRAVLLYAGMVISMAVLFVFHIAKILVGKADFLSLNILASLTDTLLGRWFDLSSFSMVIAMIILVALSILPMSKKAKIFSWIIVAVSGFFAFVVNDVRTWTIATLVFLGLTVVFSFLKMGDEPKTFKGFVKKLAWIPLVAVIISGIMAGYGAKIAGPVITGMKLGYSELSLPWQMTMDVTSGSIKSAPLFGIGPNQFGKAFLAFKPAVINSTDAWSVEFNYGFGLLPTFIATQGMVGAILWILFFIFFGILGVRSLKRLPQEPSMKFTVISSFAAASFLWLMMLVSVPSHSLLLVTFVLTGILAGASLSSGSKSYEVSPDVGSKIYKFMPGIAILFIIIMAVWGMVYLRKSVAMAYFASGVKQLNVSKSPEKADASFKKALMFDSSDVYWQARVEAKLVQANGIVTEAQSKTQTASSTEVIMKQLETVVNEALQYAKNAVTYDPSNYYNHLSEARVSEVAANLKFANGYENALQAYSNAISLNQLNPAIYLNLARLQVSQNKLDEALQTAGVAIQVKNNYLDGIFLISQIAAAQGNLKDAITAATVATQINPQNPLLFFQLGILEYNNKNYTAAVTALEKALSMQADYANAKYFLGLSYARLNKNAEAIAQFEAIAAQNADNEEINFILTNLKAGKSPFADAQPEKVTTPDKKTTLPVKETPKK